MFCILALTSFLIQVYNDLRASILYSSLQLPAIHSFLATAPAGYLLVQYHTLYLFIGKFHSHHSYVLEYGSLLELDIGLGIA